MKIHAIAIQSLQDTRGLRAKLDKAGEEPMKAVGGSVNSASGRTAVAAINFCEKHGWPYRVTCRHGMYFVERLPDDSL